MALISMKVDEKESYAAPADNPYGYGLCIYLNEDQVEALGLSGNPPRPGTSVGIRAIAQVVSVTQDADLDQDGDGVDTSLRLQITDLEVQPTGAMSSDASLLYGS